MFYVLSRVFSHNKNRVTCIIVYLLQQQKMGIEMIYVTVTVPVPSSMREVKELPTRSTSTVKASCLAGETAQSYLLPLKIIAKKYMCCQPCSLVRAILRKAHHKACSIRYSYHTFLIYLYIYTCGLKKTHMDKRL